MAGLVALLAPEDRAEIRGLLAGQLEASPSMIDAVEHLIAAAEERDQRRRMEITNLERGHDSLIDQRDAARRELEAMTDNNEWRK